MRRIDAVLMPWYGADRSKEPTVRYTISLSDTLRERLSRYRRTCGAATLMEAIRRLLDTALKAEGC